MLTSTEMYDNMLGSFTQSLESRRVSPLDVLSGHIPQLRDIISISLLGSNELPEKEEPNNSFTEWKEQRSVHGKIKIKTYNPR